VSRFTRQIRLREIGERGQAKLEAAEIVLGGRGEAREVERTYLRLAGARPLEAGAPGAALDVDVTSLGFRHATARAVGEGALRALTAILRILEVG
jgi:hypothetical protein